MLIPSPEAAYDVCKEFMPACNKPIGSVSEAAGSSTSNAKRQLPLSVTSSGGDNLVYAQAPNGSFIVSTVVYSYGNHLTNGTIAIEGK